MATGYFVTSWRRVCLTRKQRLVEMTKALWPTRLTVVVNNLAKFFVATFLVVKLPNLGAMVRYLAQGSQSIKINITKPLDISISIDKLNLSVINVNGQSIKLDTHMLAKFHSYQFYWFYKLTLFISLCFKYCILQRSIWLWLWI